MIYHLANLFFYGAFNFFFATILAYTFAGMIDPLPKNVHFIKQFHSVAGATMILMVLSVLGWGAVELFDMWWNK